MSKNQKLIIMAALVVAGTSFASSHPLIAIPLILSAIGVNLSLLRPLIRVQLGRFGWGGFGQGPAA